MEDKKPEAAEAAPASPQTAPQDALEKTNEELAKEQPIEAPADGLGPDGKPPKKLNPLKKFFRRFNVYLLLFLLILVVAGAVSAVAYLNSKKTPKAPTTQSQTLTADALKQLANSDATVGDSGQTLTVQGNAVFSGQVLVRSNLNVAGTIQLGSTLSVPSLTVSGATNLQNTQVNSLQVANGSTFQGTVTIQNDLNVGGTTAFSGAVTAGQITVTKLIMSGNATLDVPNHLAFTGASPSRTIDAGVLGSGGSASINGSDTAGTININTGSGPSSGCMVSLTFNKPFTGTAHVVITPIGTAAGQTQFYVDRSNTGFSVCSDNIPPGNAVLAYDYFVTD
ncbi:MAG: hypothetical protein WDN27_01125 [Candidatus Saccharibacteria bacterium]